jgi:thiamine biosynthesis lipoprotein
MGFPSGKAPTVLAVGAFLLLALLLGLWWQRPPQLLLLEGSTMGTSWQVQVVDDRSLQKDGLATDIAAVLQRLDQEIFSTWVESSELSRLNASDDERPVQVSAELFEVLQAAVRLHGASDGAFDASIGPLVDLWGFGPLEVEVSPDPEAIAAARARLGLPELQLDAAARTLVKPARLQLDLSGIAKGYAVDRLAALLQQRGAVSFLVEIGGELRLQGRRPDGRAWILAIESPDPEQRSVQVLIDSRGEPLALAGSGDYRNYRLVDGVRQSHEIDPLRGVPVQHGLAAVTVLADSAMEADAWATALMVLGPADGRRIADRLGLSAYFIIRDGDAWTSQYTGRFDTHLISEQPEAPTASAMPSAKE